MNKTKEYYIVIGLVNTILFLGLRLLHLQQDAYSQSQNSNQSSSSYQTYENETAEVENKERKK